MRYFGAIVLSFEEAGDLAGILPWKSCDFPTVQEKARSLASFHGVLHLSTCNRVEIIYSSEPENHEDVFSAFMKSMPQLAGHVQPAHLTGRDVVTHLVRLACGLESMVLGETEIRAQLKEAHNSAHERGFLDRRLKILFRYAFQEAREVRSRLTLRNLPLSVSALATRKMAEAIGMLEAKSETAKKLNAQKGAIGIIGSGPMSRAAAEYVSKWTDSIILINRTVEKVQEQADRLGGRTMSFDTFLNHPESMGPLRAIVTATSRPDAFITAEFLNGVERGPDKNIALVDMAVPPDVDPALSGADGVTLISMETLREELQANRAKREEAAKMAEGMIQEALVRVEAGLAAGLSGKVLQEIQADVRTKSRHHLENLLSDKLSHLSAKDRRLLYTWAIQANRDMNRIHRQGLESVIRGYIAQEYS